MKFRPLASAAVFAGVTSAGMLFGSLATPASHGATFGVFGAQAALADEEDHGGNGDRQNEDCINPAGHERGRCDHGDGENNEHRFKHHKHHRDHGQNSQYATISGTVLSVNGNTAQIRLDDGRRITVDTAGTQVGIGQHLSLNGCYQNGIFVVNCNGSQYGGNGNGYGQQQVHGTILSVSGNIVTLVGLPPVRVDITRAQANNAIYGQLMIARSITAYGYSQNGTFYATSIR